MAEVFIPSAMRDLTGGESRATVPGATVGELIDALEGLYPGIKKRLLSEQRADRLRPGLALSIDGENLERGRLSAKVGENSKVFFVAAQSGG